MTSSYWVEIGFWSKSREETSLDESEISAKPTTYEKDAKRLDPGVMSVTQAFENDQELMIAYR